MRYNLYAETMEVIRQKLGVVFDYKKRTNDKPKLLFVKTFANGRTFPNYFLKLTRIYFANLELKTRKQKKTDGFCPITEKV